ncbi:hypothetical protein L930_01600 [Helicobacter pylori PZ5004]|nr:hypothetical protein L930_01600 [Helicobacter pylori PZ5004]
MLLNSVLYKIKDKTNQALLEDIVAEKTKQKQ